MTHLIHLLGAEQRRLTDGPGLQVNAGEGFHLHGQGQSPIKRGADHHLAMLSHQTGQASLQGFHHAIGELLRAEGGVGGAADVMATGHRNHVVEGRDAAAMAGQGGGVNRMAVQHRLHLRPAGQHIRMQPPL
jgi:hypothetical protein